tara:strand:+ start:124 stop:339 length:216 start_codon:yes stop_codon:yes gene_type:complete
MNALYAVEEDQKLSKNLTVEQKELIKKTVKHNPSAIVTGEIFKLVANKNNNCISAYFKNLVSDEVCKYLPC